MQLAGLQSTKTEIMFDRNVAEAEWVNPIGWRGSFTFVGDDLSDCRRWINVGSHLPPLISTPKMDPNFGGGVSFSRDKCPLWCSQLVASFVACHSHSLSASWSVFWIQIRLIESIFEKTQLGQRSPASCSVISGLVIPIVLSWQRLDDWQKDLGNLSLLVSNTFVVHNTSITPLNEPLCHEADDRHDAFVHWGYVGGMWSRGWVYWGWTRELRIPQVSVLTPTLARMACEP